jgi:hypothetical protein
MVLQFELDLFVNINNKKKVCEWFKEYKFRFKTIILQIKSYKLKKTRIFQENATIFIIIK